MTNRELAVALVGAYLTEPETSPFYRSEVNRQLEKSRDDLIRCYNYSVEIGAIKSKKYLDP